MTDKQDERVKVRFQAINPDSQEERALLLEQRRDCKWADDEATIDSWLEKTREKTRTMAIYWIYLLDDGHPDPVGHVSLTFKDTEQPELADPTAGTAHLGYLYIVPAYRKRGIATTAVRAMEDRTQLAGGQALTLTAMPEKHITDEAFWSSHGMPIALGSMYAINNEGWYRKLGWEVFGESSTTIDGPNGLVELPLIKMRKELTVAL